MTADGDARLVDAVEAAAYSDMFAAADPALTTQLGLSAEQVGGATLLVAADLPVTLFNRAIGLGNARPATEADVDAIIAAYRAAGCKTFMIHVNPVGQPSQLRDWLVTRGARLPARRAWAKMQRGTAPPPTISTAYDLRAARPDEGPALAQALATGFEMPPSLAGWLEGILFRPGWRSFVALADGRIVGGSCLYIDPAQPGDAWLGVSAVLPAFRNRGAQGALMALRIREAIAAGCTRIVTETGMPIADESNPSLANMVRCGFRQVCARLNYEFGSTGLRV